MKLYIRCLQVEAYVCFPAVLCPLEAKLVFKTNMKKGILFGALCRDNLYLQGRPISQQLHA